MCWEAAVGLLAIPWCPRPAIAALRRAWPPHAFVCYALAFGFVAFKQQAVVVLVDVNTRG